MPILMLSTDLMFSTRVAGAASRLGTKSQTAATPEAVLVQLAATGPNPVLVIDLTTRSFDPKQWVPEFRKSANPPAAILAYGPHVQDALLTAASEAGCEVFTRGEFNARMDEILAQR